MERVSSFFWRVWSFIRGVFLFLPRILHNLFVPPDDDDQGGEHLLTWEFGQAYRHLPSLLRSLAFKTRNLDEQLRESMLKGNLRRTFTQFDLVMVGIGLVVGSGVFYKGGIVQGTLTGSAVFLGYLVDFVPIFLTALVFAEFTVEYPVAGGAFTWTMSTLGEFPAVLTLGFLTVNYVLSIAAVARVLTSSIAVLFNIGVGDFVIDIGGTSLDFLSFAFVLFLTLVLCAGTRESGLLLAAANITGLFFILFVGIAGFTESQPQIFSEDWLPEGTSGLFMSLPVLLFSYIGFDAIAYSIEEAKDVEDAPPAYMWTVVISMLLYVFMALSLAFMIPSTLLNVCTNTLSELVPCNADGAVPAYTQAFVFAFDRVGMHWMQYIFAVGSIVCIVTTLLVALFVGARLVMVGAREWMLPPVLATVSTRTKTPIFAQILVGVLASILALFTGYSKLSDLASFAYLFTMLVVCNAYLGRRYYPDVKLRYSQYGTIEATAGRFMSTSTSKDADLRKDLVLRGKTAPTGSGSVRMGTAGSGASEETKGTGNTRETLESQNTQRAATAWTLVKVNMSKKVHRAVVWTFLILINASSICTGVLYRVFPQSLAAIWALVAWAVITILMWMICPVEYEPKSWKIHRYFLPTVPSVAILGVVFVSSNLEVFNYTYFLIIGAAVSLFYVFFSMPLSYIRKYSSASKGDGVRVIELVYKHGNWISVDQMTTRTSYVDDRYGSESPGINSLPGSIVDQHRTISRTLSKMGSLSPLTSGLSGRISSEWSELSSWGSTELYKKPTAKRGGNHPTLETITDNSLQTSDGEATRVTSDFSLRDTRSDPTQNTDVSADAWDPEAGEKT